MKKLLVLLSALLCMALPPLSLADMQEIHPRQLAAGWQEVLRLVPDGQKTIRVRDKAAALEILLNLGASGVPEDGVKLSWEGLAVTVKRGEKGSGVFYVLQAQDKEGAIREIRIVPQ